MASKRWPSPAHVSASGPWACLLSTWIVHKIMTAPQRGTVGLPRRDGAVQCHALHTRPCPLSGKGYEVLLSGGA